MSLNAKLDKLDYRTYVLLGDSEMAEGSVWEALAAASDLIHQGAHVHAITHSTVKNKSVATLKLWGVALSRLKKHEPLNLTYTYITQQDLIDHQFDETESEGIANFFEQFRRHQNSSYSQRDCPTDY
jgi:hypothetical protein